MIIAATDFSDEAGNALRRAALLAQRLGEPLEILHVVSRPALDAVREWVPVGAAERLVEDVRVLLEREASSTGVAAKAHLAVGDVLEEILGACANASMLVVGAHGLNPLRDAILGTTAVRLVGRCAAPILVVRGPPQAGYRSVLVALDLLPGSGGLIEAALRVAPGAAIAAAHAYHVPFEGALHRAGVELAQIEEHRRQAATSARMAIDALAAAAGATRLMPMLARAQAAPHVLASERSFDADLVVIGKRRSALASVLLGSVTRHVLADARADVLVANAG